MKFKLNFTMFFSLLLLLDYVCIQTSFSVTDWYLKLIMLAAAGSIFSSLLTISLFVYILGLKENTNKKDE